MELTIALIGFATAVVPLAASLVQYRRNSAKPAGWLLAVVALSLLIPYVIMPMFTQHGQFRIFVATAGDAAADVLDAHGAADPGANASHTALPGGTTIIGEPRNVTLERAR